MYENDTMKPIIIYVDIKFNLKKETKQTYTHPEDPGELSVA